MRDDIKVVPVPVAIASFLTSAFVAACGGGDAGLNDYGPGTTTTLSSQGATAVPALALALNITVPMPPAATDAGGTIARVASAVPVPSAGVAAGSGLAASDTTPSFALAVPAAATTSSTPTLAVVAAAAVTSKLAPGPSAPLAPKPTTFNTELPPAPGSPPSTASAPAASNVPAPSIVATASALNTAQELASANAAAWPFVQPAISSLRASSKKVFAHYFTPFPVSLDNLPASSDYYAVQYMQPTGESNKFSGSGGFIKQRPLPRPVLNTTTWDQTDATQDIRRAAALGIDGFALNLLASTGVHWDRILRMLDQAQATDTGFKLLLMPDMEAEFKGQPQNLLPVLRILARHPAAHRLADGRLVLAPYNAQNQSVAWWTQLMNTLRAEGINVAFFPVFQNWQAYAASYGPISVGLSDWGERSPGANRSWNTAPAKAKTYNTMWMAPASPQDSRAKDLLYWEARNSENYRLMWENAINGGADWVQIITWNDYSEATEIAPSSGTQWSFYDLTAYYTAWFKTGMRPAVTRDALYYFHRKHASTATPQAGKQRSPYIRAAGSDSAVDDIEVLVFATAAGTLRVSVGSQTTERAVTAGLTSVRVPLAEGTPVFELTRNNSTVASARSAFPISNSIVYQDMLYRSGSSLRALVAPQ